MEELLERLRNLDFRDCHGKRLENNEDFAALVDVIDNLVTTLKSRNIPMWYTVRDDYSSESHVPINLNVGRLRSLLSSLLRVSPVKPGKSYYGRE